ncbi:MAG: DUF177 domain-containing protein [Gammaproteobacteria bacterium]|nr:DUF177 domain-containing protein [Gammaproteobacteria bacterium]
MKVSLRDYARNSRRWRGELPIASFDRLVREISTDTEFVDVELAFSHDENKYIRMQGQATVTAEVACHRCSESVATTIRADIDARIVQSDEIAQNLAQEADVIVVTDNPVSVTDLVEDDLIMSIPWRVCERQEDCPNLSEGKGEDTRDGNVDDATQKPFANLRQLLKDS